MRTRIWKSKGVWFIGIITVFTAVSAWSRISKEGRSLDGTDFLLLLLPALVIAMFILRIRSSLGKNFDANPRIQQPITYEFSDAGVLAYGVGFRSEFQWDNFIKLEEMKTMVFLYNSATMANLIKKADISADQIAAIKGRVNSNA